MAQLSELSGQGRKGSARHLGFDLLYSRLFGLRLYYSSMNLGGYINLILELFIIMKNITLNILSFINI